MRIKTARDLGHLFRDRRRLLGLGQQELASRVGVSRQWIVGIEKGKSRAEVGLLLRTAAALGIVLLAEIDQPADTRSKRSRTPSRVRPAETQNIDLNAVIERARRRSP